MKIFKQFKNYLPLVPVLTAPVFLSKKIPVNDLWEPVPCFYSVDQVKQWFKEYANFLIKHDSENALQKILEIHELKATSQTSNIVILNKDNSTFEFSQTTWSTRGSVSREKADIPFVEYMDLFLKSSPKTINKYFYNGEQVVGFNENNKLIFKNIHKADIVLPKPTKIDFNDLKDNYDFDSWYEIFQKYIYKSNTYKNIQDIPRIDLLSFKKYFDYEYSAAARFKSYMVNLRNLTKEPYFQPIRNEKQFFEGRIEQGRYDYLTKGFDIVYENDKKELVFHTPYKLTGSKNINLIEENFIADIENSLYKKAFYTRRPRPKKILLKKFSLRKGSSSWNDKFYMDYYTIEDIFEAFLKHYYKTKSKNNSISSWERVSIHFRLNNPDFIKLNFLTNLDEIKNFITDLLRIKNNNNIKVEIENIIPIQEKSGYYCDIVYKYKDEIILNKQQKVWFYYKFGNDEHWDERFQINIKQQNSSITNIFKSTTMTPLSPMEKEIKAWRVNLKDNFNKIDNPLLSQTEIVLIPSKYNNEELIINDNVLPAVQAQFVYKIAPKDKRLKIQLKIYNYSIKDGVIEIDKEHFKLITITEDLFEDLLGKQNISLYDEILFESHSWNPGKNWAQAQKINPYLIDRNFKEIKDKNGNFITNPNYDSKINHLTGLYETTWTLSNIKNLPKDFLNWPEFIKTNEELNNFYGSDNRSVISKVIYADSGVILKFGSGFKSLEYIYLGRDFEYKPNEIYKLPTNAANILYFNFNQGDGYYVFKAQQKQGIAKYYILYQNSEPFKSSEHYNNLLEQSFNKLKEQNKVNSIYTNKYFDMFVKWLKKSNIDPLGLAYTDLIIKYEQFLTKRFKSQTILFSKFETDKFINDFKKWLQDKKFIVNNKLDISKVALGNEDTTNKFAIKQLLILFMENPELKEEMLDVVKSDYLYNTGLLTYFATDPEFNIKPERTQQIAALTQPENRLQIYEIDLINNKTYNSYLFNYDNPTIKIDLINLLKDLGVKVVNSIEFNWNESNIKQFLEQRTYEDWATEYGVFRYESVELFNKNLYHFINDLKISGKSALDYFNNDTDKLKEFISKLKINYNIKPDNKVEFQTYSIQFSFNDEEFLQPNSKTVLTIDYPKYSNPFSYFNDKDLIKSLESKTTEEEINDYIKTVLTKKDLIAPQYLKYKKDKQAIMLNYLIEFIFNESKYSELYELLQPEYTKYLSDDELKNENNIKYITLPLILKNWNEEHYIELLKNTIKQAKTKNSTNLDTIFEQVINDFNKLETKDKTLKAYYELLKKELDKQKITFEPTFDLVNEYEKIEFLQNTIDYWINRNATKAVKFYNHSSTIYNMELKELIKDIADINLEIKEITNEEMKKVKDFLWYKQLEYVKRNQNPYKYRMNSKSLSYYNMLINQLEHYINNSNELNNLKAYILYQIWNNLDIQAETLSENKLERIYFISHFIVSTIYALSSSNVEKDINLMLNALTNFVGWNEDNDGNKSASFNLGLKSFLPTLTGTHSIKLNIKVDKVIAQNPIFNQKINLSSLIFNELEIKEPDKLNFEALEKLIWNHIIEITGILQIEPKKLKEHIIFENLNKELLTKIKTLPFIPKEPIDKLENRNNVKFYANDKSTIFTGKNNFDTVSYFDYNEEKEKTAKAIEEAKKKTIIWISSVITAIVLITAITSLSLVIRKKRLKVKK